MRVVYIVSVTRKGLGGHYHSLSAIASSIADLGHDVSVVSFGYRRSPVLHALSPKINTYHIEINNPIFSFPFSKLWKLIRQLDPHAIHAFDEHAFLPARIIAKCRQIPVVLTKCGGPLPKYFFPRGDTLTVFSKADHGYFLGKWRQVLLLPNRVRSFRTDNFLVRQIQERIPKPYNFHILRITRIGFYYKKTLLASITLLNELRKHGVNACLIIVGAIYDPDVHSELKKLGGVHVYIFTDATLVTDAKRILAVADIVIGTGRSLMEAASLGLPVLSPVSNLDIPVLLTSKNLDAFLDENFSERSVVNVSRDNAIKDIAALVNDDTYRNAKQEVLRIASELFQLEPAIKIYHDLYNGHNKTNRLMTTNLLVHYIFYKYRLAKAWVRLWLMK